MAPAEGVAGALTPLQEARVLVSTAASTLAGMARPPSSLGLFWQPELAAGQAAQRLGNTLSPQLLLVPDQSLFWGTFAQQVVLPLFAGSQESAAAADRVWSRLMGGMPAAVGPEAGLLQQLQYVHAQLLQFVDQVQDAAARFGDAAQRQNIVALLQAQQAQLRALAARPPPQAGGAGGSVKTAAQNVMRGREGCQYWSGAPGSCFAGDACPEAASHVPGQPSAKYQAKKQVYVAAGYQMDDLGNFRRGAAGGAAAPGGGRAAKRGTDAAFGPGALGPGPARPGAPGGG